MKDRSRMWSSTRLGYVWLNNYGDLYGPKHWTLERGRCKERILRIKYFGWTLEFGTRGKTYRELTGLEINDIDWIIDEFDSSFNDLAVASLRYHMDWSVCICPDDRRARYQDLINRLTEPRPKMIDTPEKKLAWNSGNSSDNSFSGRLSGMDAIFEDFRRREDEYLARISQARHDFVDIMPTLWS